MRSKCNAINWDEVLSGDTIDEQWKGLKDIINMLEDDFIPHRIAGSCNRHKGKLPLDEASVRKIKTKTYTVEKVHGDQGWNVLYRIL